MNIFRLFESKKFMEICSKTHQIAPFRNIFPGKHAPESLYSKRLAMPRVAIKPPKLPHPPWQILHTTMDYTTEKFI